MFRVMKLGHYVTGDDGRSDVMLHKLNVCIKIKESNKSPVISCFIFNRAAVGWAVHAPPAVYFIVFLVLSVTRPELPRCQCSDPSLFR